VPLITAALFAGTHLPNWFLMLVTFATGYYSTKIFVRYRNLYFLGLAHALIGTVLFVAVPDSISHHLTVGPSFFNGARTIQPVIRRSVSKNSGNETDAASAPWIADSPSAHNAAIANAIAMR
jgi:hypothetical protein